MVNDTVAVCLVMDDSETCGRREGREMEVRRPWWELALGERKSRAECSSARPRRLGLSAGGPTGAFGLGEGGGRHASNVLLLLRKKREP